MAARDIGGRASQGEIGPGIKGSVLPRMHAAPGAGEPGAGYDGRAMPDTGLAKKTVTARWPSRRPVLE